MYLRLINVNKESLRRRMTKHFLSFFEFSFSVQYYFNSHVVSKKKITVRIVGKKSHPGAQTETIFFLWPYE